MWADMMSSNPPPMKLLFRRPALVLAVLISALIGLHLNAFGSMFEIWWNAKTFNHCLLIPFISAYLIYQNRAHWSLLPPVPSAAGFALLAVSSVIIVIASLARVNAALHFALISAVLALIWMVMGNAFARQNRFALLYLYFAVPFGEFLVPVLQDVTADMAVGMLRLIDIPTFTDGRFIEIPTGSFLVAEACSGISYLIAALALGTLFAHLYYRSVWRKTLFIMLSIVVPILANGVRAFLIIYIAYKTNNEYAIGIDHLIYGWIFFGIVMLLMFMVGQLFAEAPVGAPKVNPGAISQTGYQGNVLVVTSLLLISVSHLLAQRAVVQPNTVPQLTSLSSTMQPAEQDMLGVRFRGAAWQRVWRWQSLQIVIGYFPYEQDGRELVTSAHQLFDDEKWDVIGNPTVQIAGEKRDAYRMRNHSSDVVGMVNLPLFADGELRSAWQAKQHQLWAQLIGQSAAAYQVVVIYPPDQEALLNQPAFIEHLRVLAATLESTP